VIIDDEILEIGHCGTFYGVGVGPGDPELLTLKAFRLIVSADCCAYLVNDKGESLGASIAAAPLSARSEADSTGRLEIFMPMKRDRTEANRQYDEAAEKIAAVLEQGGDVVFLCEGDPLLFGSFAYLLERLDGRYPCEVVPGISSINAAAAELRTPLAQLSGNLAVINARHSNQQILDTLTQFDNVAILKAGQNRPRLLALLEQSGRKGEASYIEYATREEQKIVRDLDQLPVESGPYFSLFLINRSGDAE